MRHLLVVQHRAALDCGAKGAQDGGVKLIALLLVAATGCAGSFGKVNRHASRVALATSTLALICDGMQTTRMAGAGWPDFNGRHHIEGNPIMGERPSVTVVGAYFVGVITLNALAWVITPERYRSPLPVTLTATQAYQIVDNAGRGAGVCGF